MTKLYKHDLILNCCKHCNVLHIGACDSPYHVKGAKRGILLHQKLQKVCKDLIGIDIDKKAIEQLKNLGIENIFYGDVIRDQYELNLQKFDFDYIIFGDVIEHLENPGLALDNIKNLMDENTKLIITTPNCFSYANIKTYFTGKENVHPTHVFWPSYKTINRLFEIKDLRIEYFTYCSWGAYNEVRMINKMGYRIILKKKKCLMGCMFFVLKK